MSDDTDETPRPNVPVAPPGLPVLEYRSPGAKPKSTRGRSVAIGIAAVWGCVILAIVIGMANKGQAFLPMLALGGIACAVLAIVDSANKRHAGLFAGLLLGVLTVLGVGALTIAVICGAFK